MLSVIIPAFNAERFLDLQLARFEAQTFTGPWEMIVSDNGSSDATRAIAERWRLRLQHLRIVDSSECRGVAGARNIAAKHARGDCLAFADADDFVCPQWVEAYTTALKTEHFCTGPIASFFDGDELPDWSAIGSPVLRTHMGWKPYASGCNLAMRRAVFDALGGFSESAGAAEDIDFSWRAQLQGYEISLVPDARVAKRLHSAFGSRFRQHRAYGRAEIALLERFHPHGLTEFPRAMIVRLAIWSILHLPDLLLPRRRHVWAAVAGRTIGRLQAAGRTAWHTGTLRV
jgi:glycosyltransferase involved in cell wall biosynthesis